MNDATIIFPHQLFEEHPAVSLERPIYLVEEAHFFTRYLFHKQKLQFHKATLIEYYDFLISKGHTVHYVSLDENLLDIVTKNGSKKIHMTLLYDHVLEESFSKNCSERGISIRLYESPYFMTSQKRFEEIFDKKKSFYFSSFYHQQRRYFSLLMTPEGKPRGGKYSFDVENRKKIPQQIQVPQKMTLPLRASMEEAHRWVKKFSNNPGSDDIVAYPVTFLTAKEWLKIFLKDRLESFGAYEDALSVEHEVLFHSVLSPLLNSGLLTPKYVITETLAYAEKRSIPLNSLEGFIRQIVGWREFVYGVYLYKGKEQQCSNYFNHKNKLPRSFWSATTGLEPLDIVIRKVLKTGYAHHIERLMVLGNFMLLCGIDPDDVYVWFMEFFIDSYDWVMIPNIYGMSQYADGGLMTTKPYIAGANYLKKMSNYKSGVWEIIYNDLYWNFVKEQREKLCSINRLTYLHKFLDSVDAQKLNNHQTNARQFLTTFLKN
jgi:deoxyribodipyrimidine photolyase-related protein